MTEPVMDPPQEGAAGATDSAAALAPEPGGRRRKLAVLAILMVALMVLALFSGWYLMFRKPISTLPIPGIGLQTLPHYAYSIYGVKSPMGVAVSSSGDRIYVTETGAERLVHVFDQSGAEVGTFGPPKSESATRVPVYIALDPTTGDVYVSDRPSRSIYIYDKDGRFRRRFEPIVPIDGFQPLGLAFDRQGDLYVSDVGGADHRVVEFDASGAVVRSIGEPGQFNFPNGLAVDDRGNLFVADSNDGQVVVIDSTGRQIGIIPRGMADGELGLPRGTAIDDGQRLYVADSTGQALQIYTLDETTSKPRYYGTVGTEGMADGQFEYPNGVATDTRARIYITDWANDRIQVWTY